jgi:hypothetical protein
MAPQVRLRQEITSPLSSEGGVIFVRQYKIDGLRIVSLETTRFRLGYDCGYFDVLLALNDSHESEQRQYGVQGQLMA